MDDSLRMKNPLLQIQINNDKDNANYNIMNISNEGGFDNLNNVMINGFNYPNEMMAINPMFNNKLNLNDNNYINEQKFDGERCQYIDLYFRSSTLINKLGLIVSQCNINDKVSEIIKKYRLRSGDNDPFRIFYFNGKILNVNLTCSEAGLNNGASIFVVNTVVIKGAGGVKGEGDPWLHKNINIKFIKSLKNIYNKSFNYEPFGLSKLCLLKEISSKLDDKSLKNLPEIISCIMRILKNGYIETDKNIKKTIKEVLQKLKGSNIINFSEYVDETIDKNQINKMLELLDKDDLEEIKDISVRLSKYDKYMKFFHKNLVKSKQESIFEFSVISLVIMEREDFFKFEKEREKCPNRVDKILYHGTSVEPISCILTDQFKKSVDRHYQHGKGVYFTDFLDYCWFYGGEESNRANKNIIPQIGKTFTLIACEVYYNKEGFRKVVDCKYTPKKNEINFAYAGAGFETLINPDFNKFVGTEYVIWDLDQICPFISAKLERNEFCVIWRDNNFSEKPVYGNKFDPLFKKFLSERLKYIKQMAKYNIYPCETTEEALKLIERKKYNKIILISNAGSNLEGKKFIIKARKIIGNDVIALFLAYNIEHLKWIKDFKNAFFSNDPNFYEEYLQSFESEDCIKEKIDSLIKKMEKHYGVKFNFDETYLDYPNFKKEGKYSDLRFNY